MSDLDTLIKETLEGNLRAFGYVVGRFHGMAVGYAFSILNDFHLAEDAAQESFLQAFSRLDQLENPAAFPGWLRRIVFTRCDRMTRRKALETVPIDTVYEETDHSDSPVTLFERKELAAKVHRAISELNEAEKTVTSLFYITGRSIGEIAEFLEVAESTVKSRLHTARNSMKEIIARKFDDLMPEAHPTNTYQGAQQMFKTMFPELHVSDVVKAAAFFTDALGFKTGFSYEEGGKIDFAVLSHGDMTLYLHHMLPDAESAEPRRMRLYFEPRNISELHGELKSKGYQVSQIVDQTYGAKTCTLVGPDEYEIWFQQWSKN